MTHKNPLHQAALDLGRRGEDHAVEYITGLGWEVLDRNWRCRRGELDIVARDTEGRVVFVEVKTRAGLGFGSPLESITHKKARTLMGLGYQWLQGHPRYEPNIRFDAIGILMVPNRPVEFNHVRGIQTW